MGRRRSSGPDWEQTARTPEQQEDEELGRGRGSKQQETAILKIMYTNAQSILGKLNEISAYTSDEKPDFILLTETWCNPSITVADLSIPGYQLETELRKDRTDTVNGLGGGLLVYSKKGLKILPVDKMKNDFNQCVMFKLITAGDPVNVILTYRPPNSGSENLDKLCELLKEMPKNTLLIGDINLPHIN